MAQEIQGSRFLFHGAEGGMVSQYPLLFAETFEPSTYHVQVELTFWLNHYVEPVGLVPKVSLKHGAGEIGE